MTFEQAYWLAYLAIGLLVAIAMLPYQERVGLADHPYAYWGTALFLWFFLIPYYIGLGISSYRIAWAQYLNARRDRRR